jgi:PAS domain S-box-containing protein
MQQSDNFTRMEQAGWSKELLYQLVENVKEYAIYVSDVNGLIVSWNIGAEKIFGYPAGKAIGLDSRILFTEEDRKQGVPEQEMKTALEEGCAEDERWHVRRDGSFFFASGITTPLFDETGTHTGYAKISRDLTERIDLEEALQELKDDLEFRINERTGELNRSNESLRLEVTNRKQSERLRTALLRKIVRTQENERKRIALDIHDQVGQQITALKLKLKVIADNYKETELNGLISQLQTIADAIDSEADFLVWELRPSLLDDFGLSAALKKFTYEWSEHFNVPAGFEEVGLDGKQLLSEIEINLYRIGQEALNNISKHAEASNVSVLLEQRDGIISLIVEDDGKGFKPSEKVVITDNDRGIGLFGMKERAEIIGGSFEIESSVGIGTTVYVRVPAQFEESRN